MAAIARFGTRIVPDLPHIIEDCRERGALVEGPHIEAFEEEFGEFLGSGHAKACSTEYGRMALYFILKAMNFPAGSEVIVPALTFWVVPEIARHAGFKPVFVDVDPFTFNLEPTYIETAITEHTRVIVPTHLYGQPCAMKEILRIAEKHNLIVVEDCAQAVGARYHGRLVGTFGAASFFSFQMLKGINTYGGGMALTNNPEIASRVRDLAAAEPEPTRAETPSIHQ